MRIATVAGADPAASADGLAVPVEMVGESAAIQEVMRLIERVAATEASVLLTGESGSGKQVAAQAIHQRGRRRQAPFVSIDCGAIPAAIVETELFGGPGHAGAIERANGGTLLFDDVTQMPLLIQSRLLRALETQRFYRSGDDVETMTDVRIIAATNRCPLQAVQTGRLREDLLYRLAVFPIELPPLRSRGTDAALLAEHFLAALNGRHHTQKKLSALSRMTLRRHTWPGNVREIKNCVERAFILAEQTLELEPLHISGSGEASKEANRLDVRVGSRIDEMERSLIEATLDHFKGNKRRAADTLGCSLKTLYNKLNGYSQSQECASH